CLSFLNAAVMRRQNTRTSVKIHHTKHVDDSTSGQVHYAQNSLVKKIEISAHKPIIIIITLMSNDTLDIYNRLFHNG
ncbi:hypothetical protein ACJX0J_032028, partial [Zea mays]